MLFFTYFGQLFKVLLYIIYFSYTIYYRPNSLSLLASLNSPLSIDLLQEHSIYKAQYYTKILDEQQFLDFLYKKHCFELDLSRRTGFIIPAVYLIKIVYCY